MSVDNLLRFGPRLGKAAARHLHAGFVHRLLEEHAIFGDLDRFALGADHFDAAFFEHAGIIERDREIQRGLAADCRQQRVRPFFANDCGDGFDRERLDVSVSAVSGSVMIVAGFELTSTTS